MICINFYGGPAIGKSTMAAMVFAELKSRGITAELVGEFAKDLVYDKSYNTMADQHYVFAMQAHRLWRLANYGTEVAVCDSPLLLTMAYNRDPNNGHFNPFVIDTYNRYENFDYVLERCPEYWKKDKRTSDVQKGIYMDNKIDAILLDIFHEKYPKRIPTTNPAVVKEIVDEVQRYIKKRDEENAKNYFHLQKKNYQDEPWKEEIA